MRYSGARIRACHAWQRVPLHYTSSILVLYYWNIFNFCLWSFQGPETWTRQLLVVRDDCGMLDGEECFAKIHGLAASGVSLAHIDFAPSQRSGDLVTRTL